MRHTACCQERIDRSAAEAEAWIAAWPNSCAACFGWGGHYSTYDPSPAGVSLGSGTMEDFSTCALCVDRDHCPRCAAVIVEYPGGLKCSLCGWSDRIPGCPKLAECLCHLDEDLQEGHSLPAGAIAEEKRPWVGPQAAGTYMERFRAIIERCAAEVKEAHERRNRDLWTLGEEFAEKG